MARPKTVWGIDIGQCALKALKLRDADGVLQVEAFEVIEHPVILSQPDADQEQLIREALQRFLNNVDLGGCHVVVAVPGQSSFSRFVKLPPVESRRVPDIVRFEAEQQIPFPINEVIWRWQTFHDPDSPDVEVGLFAMKRSDVADTLRHFDDVGMRVDTVQMAPLALYNFMKYDEQTAEDGATLLADVGADKTDLVVADKGRIWTRTIQIGGNNFTEALVRTFKLSFEKAEALKRSAATSKYARQIFQAMRPVFADLVQEIQRSIGYYTSLHRDTRFRKLLGLGNGFRLPGLQKFIEQNLNVPVARIDSYTKIAPSSSVNAPAVNENVLSFAVAYGLAVQGLGQAEVSTNLLPDEIMRKRRWSRKRPWFVAAAVVLLAALFCPGYRASLDSDTLNTKTRMNAAGKVVADLNRLIGEYRKIENEGFAEEREIKRRAQLFAYRSFWPSMLAVVEQSIDAVAPNQPDLLAYARMLDLQKRFSRSYERIAAGTGENLRSKDLDAAAAVLLDDDEQLAFRDTFANATEQGLQALAKRLVAETGVDANSLAGLSGEALKDQAKRLRLLREIKRAEALKAMPRAKRKVVFMEGLAPTYIPSLPTEAGDVKGKPGFKIELVGRTPLPRVQANTMVADLRAYSVALGRFFSSLSVGSHRVEWLPMQSGGAARGKALDDPLMEGETMADDTRFKVVWLIAIMNDDVVLADVTAGGKYVLGKPAEMVPELAPADALAAVKAIKPLPAGTTIAIETRQEKGAVPWFRVKATDSAGKAIGEGWVSGAALDEQGDQLKPATATP